LPREAAVCSLAVVGVVVLLVTPALAQEGIFAGMQKGLELTASSVSTTTTFASGLVTKTETTNLYPALTLNLDALVYPNLRLNGGGVFEVNMLSTRTGTADTDSTITRNRPFFLLRSTNPVFSPGFGYFRREDRARTAGLSDVKLVNDEYAAYVGWNPAGGPRSEFQFVRTHTFDGTRAVQDVTRDFGTLISNYTFGNFGAYYRGSYLKTDDQLLALDTRQVIHAARLSDSGSLFRKRLFWDATYNITYQDVTTGASANGGEIAIPVAAFAGLSSLSDTPTISRLPQNALLVDGNLTAGAGINLGLATPPADTQARNLGIDFLNPTEVNRFLIWVDRDLPIEVAGAFSWEIYSSIDNITWRRETVASAARFGPFENRFEIDFPGVTARYVKVVTRPLAATVPDAGRFTTILVTELQPFVRRLAGQDRSSVTQTTHLVNSDVRMRLLDAPSMFYEGFFLYHGPSAFGTNTATLSNGVSLNHAFGRIFSAYARGAVEEGTEARGDRTAFLTNATLTIDPIPTFRSSLLYTGQDERIEGVPSDRRGFFVQNAAQLYRGIDLLFGIGWNVTTRETGETSHDRLVNATATIVPRQHVSLTFSYDDTRTEYTGTFAERPDGHVQRLYAAVAVDPIRTLHLVLGREVIVVPDQPTRSTLDLAANWTPFPDGALQFVFAHNEALRDVEFGKDRSTVGLVRWNLSRRSYADVSYQRTRSEFVFQATETKVLSFTLRLFV
jgi:hypothetical protein